MSTGVPFEGGGESMLDDIVEFLGRRHRVTDLDRSSGRMNLSDGERTVPVELAPQSLEEYAAQLDDDSIPGLSDHPTHSRGRIRARHVALWIEELIESDLESSLLEIYLGRNSEGALFVDCRRSAVATSFPPTSTAGGYWAADPTG
jgi:hypothetical protein